MDEDTASMYLEMAGGDMDAAMGLYFSMMDDGSGGGGGDGGGGLSSLGFQAPEMYAMVWEDASRPPPESWRVQGLAFSPEGGLGLPQAKNGPCGVLAAFQASLIARCHRTRRAAFFAAGADFTPDAPLIAETLADLLLQSCVVGGGGAEAGGLGDTSSLSSSGSFLVRLPRFTGAIGEAIQVDDVTQQIAA